MDNTTIVDRLKAIEEGLRLQKKVFNQLTFIDTLDYLRVLFTSSPLLVKYLALGGNFLFSCLVSQNIGNSRFLELTVITFLLKLHYPCRKYN